MSTYQPKKGELPLSSIAFKSVAQKKATPKSRFFLKVARPPYDMLIKLPHERLAIHDFLVGIAFKLLKVFFKRGG